MVHQDHEEEEKPAGFFETPRASDLFFFFRIQKRASGQALCGKGSWGGHRILVKLPEQESQSDRVNIL
jgi:hypothetical protein